MIIVRLMGGLGNQMFQFAFAKNLSLKYNKELRIDLSFLNEKNRPAEFVFRQYDLDIFNIEDSFIEDQKYIEISEKTFHYDESIMKHIDENIHTFNILLVGYFQSPLYFLEKNEIVKECFTFRDDLSKCDNLEIKSIHKDIIESNSVMINFRRTDYLNNDFHGVFGMDFVSKAINHLNLKKPKFFVFSDDIEWCLQNVKLENMILVDHSFKGDRFSYYLQLMMNCKNFIIPNSTFAWWAAYLCKNPEKQIICPSKWFNDPSIDTSDLIPKNWIRI